MWIQEFTLGNRIGTEVSPGKEAMQVSIRHQNGCVLFRNQLRVNLPQTRIERHLKGICLRATMQGDCLG